MVDLGSNSTRLLVADVSEGRVVELDRRTEITRLGQGVDSTGSLDGDAMERVFAALEGFRAAIDRLAVGRTIGVGTSAVRDAANGAEFRETVSERFGVEARILSGEDEGRLTFLGATSARSVAQASNGASSAPDTPAPDPIPTLVVDIGGGSTELVVGHPGADPDFRVSTQAGSVRQTERHFTSDPPDHDEVADLSLEVQGIFEEAAPEALRTDTSQGIAVAGTATSLAAVDQELEPYDAARVDGYPLELGACERMVAMLAGQSLAERRAVPGLHPDRAPTIVAGAVILVEVMRAFGLEVVDTSEADILHGAALSAATGDLR